MSDARFTVGEEPVRIDRLARALYGDEANGSVEALLDANPGLAEAMMAIPPGTVLRLPTLAPAPEEAAPVRPWE